MPGKTTAPENKPLQCVGQRSLCGESYPEKPEAGAVLVMTLLVLVVLAVVAVAFMQNTTSERFTARSQSNFSRAQLAVRAGLGAACENLVRSTTNDSFIVVLNQTNRQLFVGQWLAGDTNNYTPLFSASNNITNAAIATNRVPTINVSGGTNFIVTLPGGFSVTSPVVSWVYLTNSLGQTNARFAYWLEDLSGKLDLSVVGSTGTNARRPTGTNPQEIALWSLLNPTAASDTNNADVAALVGARSNLFTVASARVAVENVTPNMMADLAVGLRHDTNEPQLIPFGFGYAQQGQRKLNLNANLSAAGVTNITNAIRINLPLFASTNRSGGMPPTNYINYLTANIVDYADADSTNTVVGTDIGNEPMPWLNEIWDLTLWKDEGASLALVTNVSGGVTNYIANISVMSFAEFWNMTDKEFTAAPGDLVFTQTQTNRQARGVFYVTNQVKDLVAGSWSYTNSTNIVFRPNDYVVLMVASNRIALDFGTNIIPPYGAIITNISGTNTNTYRAQIVVEDKTNNSFVTYTQYWRGVTNDLIANALYGLRRLSSPAQREPQGTLGVWDYRWAGNSFVSPTDLANGRYGDPRINRYLNATRLQGNNYASTNTNTHCTWGGRNTNASIGDLRNWPDGSFVTNLPIGYRPTNNSNLPTAAPISAAILTNYSSNALVCINNSGEYSNVCELGNIFDPLQWVVNGLSAPSVITNGAVATNSAGGGQSLRIGRAEHPRFAVTTNGTYTNGLRASQLLDIFEVGPATAAMVTNVPAGRVNINTATTNVLRALAAGVYHTSDPVLNPNGTNFVVPATAVDAFVAGVTNFRSQQPFYAPSQLTLVATNTNVTNWSDWASSVVFGSKNIGGVTEWSDSASEEWFSKIYPLSTVRSRNFLIFVVGQAVPTNAPTTKVDSDAVQVFQVYVEPSRTNGMTTNSRSVIIRSWSL